MKWLNVFVLVMIASFLIAGLWDRVPIIKESVHFVLDPTAGKLLNLNIYLGMFVIVFLFTLLTILVQKYLTDQNELKRIKDEQKIMQEEMKKYRDNPDKLLELNKKQMESFPKTMELTMAPLIYTFVPFILFFRWFSDYFAGSLADFKFFGFLSWLWFYFIFSIVFSSILRKIFKVY